MTSAVRATTAHSACARLFREYPLAVEPGDLEGELHLITLMVIRESGPEFYLLTRQVDSEVIYSLTSWDDSDRADIDSGDKIPPDKMDVLLHAVPLPRDGSLFGALRGQEVTGLLQVGTHPLPGSPEPRFSVLVPAGTPRGQWPPAASEGLFGSWFWDGCKAGRIVDLAPVIAATENTVIAVPADGIPGAGGYLTVVRVPLSGGRWTLPAGVYAYKDAVAAGTRIPPADKALASPGLIDLGPRFRVPAEAGQ
jgi:hypothetical protein